MRKCERAKEGTKATKVRRCGVAGVRSVFGGLGIDVDALWILIGQRAAALVWVLVFAALTVAAIRGRVHRERSGHFAN